MQDFEKSEPSSNFYRIHGGTIRFIIGSSERMGTRFKVQAG